MLVYRIYFWLLFMRICNMYFYDPIGEGSLKPQEQYERCSVDGDNYPEEEMVFDKDGGMYVHYSNIEEYLKNFESDMLSEDFEKLKNNLYKQIK